MAEELTIRQRAFRERARRERTRREEQRLAALPIGTDPRSLTVAEGQPVSTTRVDTGFKRRTFPTIGRAQEEPLEPATPPVDDPGDWSRAFIQGAASGVTLGGSEMFENDLPRASQYKGSLPFLAGELIGMGKPVNWVAGGISNLVKRAVPAVTKIGKAISELEMLRKLTNPTAAQSVRRLVLENSVKNAPAREQVARGAENLIRHGTELGIAGGALNAAKQGGQLAVGQRDDFSFGELGEEAAMWGALGSAMKLPPLVMKPVESLIRQKKYDAAKRLYQYLTKDSPHLQSPDVEAYFDRIRQPKLALPQPPQRKMIGLGPGYGEGFTHRDVGAADEAMSAKVESANRQAEREQFQRDLRASGTSNLLPAPKGYAAGEGFVMTPVPRDYPPRTGRVRPPELGPRPTIDELAQDRRRSILNAVRVRAQQERMRRLSGNRPMQPGDVNSFAAGGGMTLSPVDARPQGEYSPSVPTEAAPAKPLSAIEASGEKSVVGERSPLPSLGTDVPKSGGSIPAPVKGKEPWEMTFVEYAKDKLIQAKKPNLAEQITAPEQAKSYRIQHQKDVVGWLQDGKPVPPEVLKDYPDLAKKYGEGKGPTTGQSIPIDDVAKNKGEGPRLLSVGGAAYGVEPVKDENGETVGYRFNPTKAVIGLGLGVAAVEGFSRLSRGQQIRELRKLGESSGLSAEEIRLAESDIKVGKSLSPQVANKMEAGYRQAQKSAQTDFAESRVKQTEIPLTHSEKVVLEKSFPKVVDLKPQTYAQALELVKKSEEAIAKARVEMYEKIGRDPRYKRVDKQGVVSYGTRINPEYDRKEWLDWYAKREAYRKKIIEPLQNDLARIQEAADRLPRSLTKTIGGGKAYLTDFRRNVVRVLGEKDGTTLLTSKLDTAQKTHVDLITEWQNDLYDTIVKGYGIKPGSKMSAAVQQFGEKRVTYEELVKKFGQEKADNIVKADEWFRTQYDTRLNQINTVLREVYPTEPWKLIPRRSDYYHHFQVPTGLEQLRNVFFEAAESAGIVSNVPAYAKVKQRFLRFALKRSGGEFVDDAVGGYLNYTEAGAMAIAFNPMIAHTRKMAAELRKATQWAKILKDGKVVRRMQNNNAANAYATKVGGKVEPPTNNIDGFIEYLDEWADNLAGKSHLFDRAVNRISPKILDGATWINNRIKANVIAGNAGASLAQIFNMPMAVGRLNKHMIPGFSDTVAGLFVGERAAMHQSPFLRERFFRKHLQSKFEVGMLKYPKVFTSWMLRAGDEVASKIMWNGAYREAMAKGVENPIVYADDMVRSFVAGRAPGDVPLAYKSKVTQLVAPFQIEVGNLWLAIGDRVRKKEFGALVGFLLASWMFNRGAEKIRGTAVSFDPIEALIDGVRLSGEADSVPEKVGVVGGRLVGEVTSSLPLGQSVAAFVPEDVRRKYMGSRDPSRFGTGLPLVRGMQSATRTLASAAEGEFDPSLLYDVGLPFGGAQLRKSLEGAAVLDEGAVRSGGPQFNLTQALIRGLSGDEFFEGRDGRVKFRVKRSPENIARALLFGPYATDEAREYFDEQEARNIDPGGNRSSGGKW